FSFCRTPASTDFYSLSLHDALPIFSPFPVHGIDKVIGLKESRLGIFSFLYGLFGLTLALVGIRYFMIHDWPMNIGGKPSFSFTEDRKSTRLNSSHVKISYAVFCLKK